MRLDKALVQAGLVSTRSQALQYIRFGNVTYEGRVITKPSQKIENVEALSLNTDVYVGRGAKKLLKALEVFKFAVNGKVVADVGASTGGFTEVLLKEGAKRVYAIDVGHDQLAEVLQKDQRVVNFEGHHIAEFPPHQLPEKVDLVVVDLSFISLTQCLAGIESLMKNEAELVTLVKPQFEVGKEAVGKGGIVRDPVKHLMCLERLVGEFSHRGFHLSSATVSPIHGKSGNREYLFYLERSRGKGTGVSVEKLRELTERGED